MKKHLNVWAGSGIVAVSILAFGAMYESEAALGSGSAQLPIGKPCSVQFRRGDALGAAANLPVPPMSGSINGAETSVSGKLRAANEEWIVIESANQGVLWIPKTSVLLVQAAQP